MLKQTDMPEPIHSIGCFFMSCCAVAQRWAQGELSRKEIDMIWNAANERGYIVGNRIKQSAPIITMALHALGFEDFTAYEIGTFSAAEGHTWYGLGRDKYSRKVHGLIQKVKVDNGELGGFHFRVVDKRGGILYDPEPLPYDTDGIEYSILYHIKGE